MSTLTKYTSFEEMKKNSTPIPVGAYDSVSKKQLDGLAELYVVFKNAKTVIKRRKLKI